MKTCLDFFLFIPPAKIKNIQHNHYITLIFAVLLSMYRSSQTKTEFKSFSRTRSSWDSLYRTTVWGNSPLGCVRFFNECLCNLFMCLTFLEFAINPLVQIYFPFFVI